VATSNTYDSFIPGLNALLRDLRDLPKPAAAELRDASTVIANQYMVPAWQAAARNAGPWGDVLAGSVRAKRDRLPAISIGANRKAFSGGATANMVRYPSHAGRVRPSIPAAFTTTEWMASVKPAYINPAMEQWGKAVDSVVDKWNRGPNF
jgi:hypothetical protein